MHSVSFFEETTFGFIDPIMYYFINFTLNDFHLCLFLGLICCSFSNIFGADA